MLHMKIISVKFYDCKVDTDQALAANFLMLHVCAIYPAKTKCPHSKMYLSQWKSNRIENVE